MGPGQLNRVTPQSGCLCPDSMMVSVEPCGCFKVVGVAHSSRKSHALQEFSFARHSRNLDLFGCLLSSENGRYYQGSPISKILWKQTSFTQQAISSAAPWPRNLLTHSMIFLLRVWTFNDSWACHLQITTYFTLLTYSTLLTYLLTMHVHVTDCMTVQLLLMTFAYICCRQSPIPL